MTKRGCASHPQEPMQLKQHEAPYRCSGCREVAIGHSYHCGNNSCNYILDEKCANADSFAFHPFFRDSDFKFHEKAPGHRVRYCDACGKDVLGFVYHCSSTGYDLHPCCLRLKREISDEQEGVTLKLCKEVPKKCGKCKHRNVVDNVKGWSYVSSGSEESYCYHVSCVKELILENLNRTETNSTGMSDREYSQLALRSMGIVQRGESSRSSGKIRKYTKIAVLVFKLIFSAIFGNPISAIAAVMETLVSD